MSLHYGIGWLETKHSLYGLKLSRSKIAFNVFKAQLFFYFSKGWRQKNFIRLRSESGQIEKRFGVLENRNFIDLIKVGPRSTNYKYGPPRSESGYTKSRSWTEKTSLKELFQLSYRAWCAKGPIRKQARAGSESRQVGYLREKQILATSNSLKYT